MPMSPTSESIHARRKPAWSGPFTTALAVRIPPGLRGVTIFAVKAVHSLAFFSIAGLIILFAWDGLRGQPRRRTAVAATVAVAEAVVFASNNQVCPLTPLAEQLGARSGSVTDIFLPDRISRRIPLVGGTALAIGLGLNLLAWTRRAGSHR